MRRLHRRHRVPIDERVVVDMPLAMPLSAGKAFDRSQNNNDGVLGSANTWAYPGLKFENTVNSIITIGDVGDAQTFSCYFKPALVGAAAFDMIFNLEGVFEVIYANASNIVAFGIAGNATIYINGEVLTAITTAWQMCTVTIDAPESVSNLIIGSIAAIKCDGDIGDVFVSTEKYSQTQAQNLFNLTRWKYGI